MYNSQQMKIKKCIHLSYKKVTRNIHI
uniref:Uncharacterized protein n=1 Tax=Anguilla anguilla TaxID=7936 RepID=A0A0E9U8D9_ANGAN